MNISIGYYIWLSFLSGVIGTAGMTLLLFAMTKSNVINVDLLGALGSLFTKKLSSATRVGLMIHAVVGIIFAFIYVLIISAFKINTFINCIGAGILIGFIHASLVSFLLVPSVAESHPIKKFQKEGFVVAFSYWTAHILYGFLIGLVIGMTKI